mgnify:CR=1 FL=1
MSVAEFYITIGVAFLVAGAGAAGWSLVAITIHHLRRRYRQALLVDLTSLPMSRRRRGSWFN